MKNRIRMTIGFLMLIVVGGLLGINYYIYGEVANVEANCRNDIQEMNNTPDNFTRYGNEDNFDTSPYFVQDYEEVIFLSRDPEISIHGWWMSATLSAASPAASSTSDTPTVIIVHGINSCKRSGGVLTAAGMLHNNGFHVLVIDLREHGDSEVEDGRVAGGAEEYLDVLGAWDWVIAEKGIPQEKVGLMGFSFGAATVTIAMGEEPNVIATWEDSGFAGIDDIVADELTRIGVPTFFASTALMMGELISGDPITSKPPLEAVKNLNGRAYFISHGDADERVKVDYGYDLAEAINASGGQIEPWIIPGSEHTEAIFDVSDEYETRLIAFFSEALGKTQ